MYEYIKGLFMGINKDYVVVENNGMGYRIHTSGSTMAKLPRLNVHLYVEQLVREDFIGLYGFLTKEEINMFNRLLTINGVGAKAALSLLSISTVNNLKYAILTSDEKTITKAPGIGKKIAQRIILELKDKLGAEDFKTNNIREDADNKERANNIAEATEALLSLGYSEKEIDKAFDAVNKDDSVESIIKNCLKFLMS